MKLKYNWIFFLISFVAILGVRVYQILNVNNLAIKNQAVTYEIIIFLCTAFFSLLIILMSALSKNNPQKFKLHKNNPLAFISFLSATLLVVNGISNIVCLFTSSTVEIILLFTGVFSILSGVIFFVLGRCLLTAKNTFLTHQLLLLIPVLWFAMRLLGCFFKYNSLAMPIQEMSGEIAVMFLLVFSLHFARLISAMYSKNNFKKMYMYGLPAILFTLLSITFEALKMISTGVFNVYKITSFVTDIAISVFIALFVASLSKNTVDEESRKLADTEAPDSVANLGNDTQEPDNMADLSNDTQEPNSKVSSSRGNFDMNSINKLIDEISKK